jgi:hypothetical protein
MEIEAATTALPAAEPPALGGPPHDDTGAAGSCAGHDKKKDKHRQRELSLAQSWDTILVEFGAKKLAQCKTCEWAA